MIEAQGLTKQYGSLLAISDLEFRVSKGSISGIIGVSGAGKSTALRLLAGVLGPTRGAVRVCGYDIVTAPLQARRCVGYLAEGAPLYAEMTPRKYLFYRAALKGLRRTKREHHVRAAATAAGCLECLEIPIDDLPKGERQRVGLADSLLGDPTVLLLDEPTAGLDAKQAQELGQRIRALRENHAILISSQVLPEIETLCSDVLVLDRGRLVAHDSVEALLAKHGVQVKLSLRDSEHRASEIIVDFGWRLCRTREEETALTTELIIEALCAPDRVEESLESLVATLAASRIGIRKVERCPATLETAFAKLTEPDRRPLQ